MRVAWLIVAIFAGRFLVTAVYFPQGDGDLGWQRWLGQRIVESFALPERLGAETFTAPGAGWVPQEWLFSVLAYLAGHTGWFAFAGFCALCAGAALAIVAWTAARRKAHPYATALAVLCAGMALVESFGVRVQILAWPLLAAYLLLLETDGRAAYFAVAIVALWSNVHASVVLAPIVAGVVCVGNYLGGGWDARARRSALITVLCAMATCANPLGYKIPLYAFKLFASPFKSMIVEWHRTTLADYSFAFGALPLLLVILIFGVHGSRRWCDRLVLVLFAWLMFSAARNVAIFALAAVPLAAAALTSGLPYLRNRFGSIFMKRAKGFVFFETALAVTLACAVGLATVHDERAHPLPDTQPHAALAAIEALPGSHNVLCGDFAWCSFLLASRDSHVFLDGRADPYPQSVWTDYATIVRVRQNWQQTLRERNVDVVLVSRDVPLEQALLLASQWHSVYSDRQFRVWQRGRGHVSVDMSRSMPSSVNAAI